MVPYGIVQAMARKLSKFPGDDAPSTRRYPWSDWTDGSAWEIRRGEDYDVATENMRVNLHMKATALAITVQTRKIRDERGEGLDFQFLDPDAEEAKLRMATIPPDEAHSAMALLYKDALNIYERARHEVTIERSDGTRQRYAAVRYRNQILAGWDNNELVRTIARIVRKPTLGFSHLEKAGRPDLMLETLVLDSGKPYHRFFTKNTIETARQRMQEHGYSTEDDGAG
jgi:hypothetical protein